MPSRTNKQNGRLICSFVLVLNVALKRLDLLKIRELISRSERAGKGIMSDLGNVGAELLFTKDIPYLGKKAVEMGRYVLYF